MSHPEGVGISLSVPDSGSAESVGNPDEKARPGLSGPVSQALPIGLTGMIAGSGDISLGNMRNVLGGNVLLPKIDSVGVRGGSNGRSATHIVSTTKSVFMPGSSLSFPRFASKQKRGWNGWPALGFVGLLWFCKRKKRDDNIDEEYEENEEIEIQSCLRAADDEMGKEPWNQVYQLEPWIQAACLCGDNIITLAEDGTLSQETFLSQSQNPPKRIASLKRELSTPQLIADGDTLFVYGMDRKKRPVILSHRLSSDGSWREIALPKGIKKIERLYASGGFLWATGSGWKGAKIYNAKIEGAGVGSWKQVQPDILTRKNPVRISSGKETLIAGAPARDPDYAWIYTRNGRSSSKHEWKPAAKISNRTDEIFFHADSKRCLLADHKSGRNEIEVHLFSRDSNGKTGSPLHESISGSIPAEYTRGGIPIRPLGFNRLFKYRRVGSLFGADERFAGRLVIEILFNRLIGGKFAYSFF